MSISCATEFTGLPDENSKFSAEFEEYKRAQREKHEQQNSLLVEKEKKEENVAEEEKEEENAGVIKEDEPTSPTIDHRTPLMSPTVTASSSNGGASSSRGANEVRLNSSVDALRKSAGGERRNSLDKVLSFFKKDSPTLSSKDKEKIKLENEKREQDFRMAHLIAELEMSGKSEQEIQVHLFHLRDQAQFRRPRSNSVGDFFKSIQQAFKEEFTARRDLSTVHVASENPFHAAPPGEYASELGYTYEDLLTLESVPRGIKKLDHLPLLVYVGQELPVSQTMCAICMTEFQKDENLRSLQCSHYFHRECIDKWLSVGTTCPVCKGEVDDEC